jgi:tRNA A37 threonylcarbamoyladenosine dehydratase
MASALSEAHGYGVRFSGIGRLFGASGLKRLRAARVCVIGIGGVGSWTVEALARSGIGAIDMIDLDDVCVTNVNRQLPALDGQIGRPKVDVLAERVRAINPECSVESVAEFLTESNAPRLLSGPYDFVVDAVDRVAHKCVIISTCRDKNLPVVTVGGAGGKRDGSSVRVVDLGESKQDELLRQLRRKLRRDYGFPVGEGVTFGVACVYSAERPVFPWSDGTVCNAPEPGSDLHLDCSAGFGTAAFVTGAFGLAAAGEVVKRIAGCDLK